LAGGKGVTIAGTVDEACRAVDPALLDGRFGAAGAEIVVEDFLTGVEASFHALVDGKDALPLATAQDYKRVGDGDTGPNTGGMGGPPPNPDLTPPGEGTVRERTTIPATAAQRQEARACKWGVHARLIR